MTIDPRDVIDQAAGLTEDGVLHRLRRERPQFVEGAQTCHAALLSPAEDQGLPPALRMALGHRMAILNRDEALAAQYRASEGDDPTLRRLSEGRRDLPAPLDAIARHVDMVTLAPTGATADDIHALEAAGLSNPQIVALSELIAHVNFQARLAAGLRLMGAA